MLRIQSLLNPEAASERADAISYARSDAFSPPLTPALTTTTSNSSFSPRLGTPDVASPAKRQKLIKDAPVFVKGEAKGQVHYPPFESNEDTIALPPHLRDELVLQHRRFKIYPSGSEKDGLISDFVKRIPYSSEKKEFFGKNGWEGFNGEREETILVNAVVLTLFPQSSSTPSWFLTMTTRRSIL